jgi:hypothetical protein
MVYDGLRLQTSTPPTTQKNRIDPAGAIYDAGLEIQPHDSARASELFELAAAVLCQKPVTENGLTALCASMPDIAEDQRAAVLKLVTSLEILNP